MDGGAKGPGAGRRILAKLVPGERGKRLEVEVRLAESRADAAKNTKEGRAQGLGGPPTRQQMDDVEQRLNGARHNGPPHGQNAAARMLPEVAAAQVLVGKLDEGLCQALGVELGGEEADRLGQEVAAVSARAVDALKMLTKARAPQPLSLEKSVAHQLHRYEAQYPEIAHLVQSGKVADHRIFVDGMRVKEMPEDQRRLSFYHQLGPIIAKDLQYGRDLKAIQAGIEAVSLATSAGGGQRRDAAARQPDERGIGQERTRAPQVERHRDGLGRAP